jgi:hypothetical protein
MKSRKTVISLDDMLKDHPRMDDAVVAQSSQRINAIMKDVVRDFKKKQWASLEKASRIVLNA